MEDITARKQVQEALRESEAKFRASFDQAPIGAAIVSLDYRSKGSTTRCAASPGTRRRN